MPAALNLGGEVGRSDVQRGRFPPTETLSWSSTCFIPSDWLGRFSAGIVQSAPPSSFVSKKVLLLPLARRSAFAEGDWQEIWRRIAADPWFQAEVELCAAQAVRRGGAKREDAADVASGANLIIADELRVSPDLHVDVDRAEPNFTGWMGTIIRHACSKALARMRPFAPASPLLGVETTGDESATRDLRIDVLAAIDKLGEPERSIMLLRLDGRSLIEAAFVLGIPYKRADYACQRGLRHLERALRDYRPPPKK